MTMTGRCERTKRLFCANPWPLFLLLALSASPLLAQPGSEIDREAELEALRDRIQKIETDMVSAKDRARSLDDELRDSEVKIGNNTKRIKFLSQGIEEKVKRLAALNAEKAAHELHLGQEQAILANQIRSAYKMGRQDYFKILLNQQDPYTISRCLNYYDYFNRARSQRIDTIVFKLDRVKALEQAIGDEARRLQALRDEKVEQQDGFRAHRSGRKLVLAQLRKTLHDKSQHLDRLRENQRELEALLDMLQRETAQGLGDNEKLIPFAELKGQLLWPTQGKLVAHFGTPRRSGALKWRGIMIAADRGKDVQAISHGKVIYADWLRHFGLILIIDHGDGYMSLYGHNQALFREAGDWVESGEIIANVGDSGGRAETGLYFEIRYQGQPENPVYWCQVPRP